MRRPAGLPGFFVLGTGHFVSLFGSMMTGIAFGVWAWQTTGSTTALALLTVLTLLPSVFLGSVVGPLVDRWPRRWTLLLTDLAGAVGGVVVLGLYLSGHLMLWHLYALTIWNGVFQTFQVPAFAATITLTLQQDQYARANSLIGLTQSVANVFAPVLGGLLISTVQLQGVLAIDVASFLVAVATVLLVRIVPLAPVSGTPPRPRTGKQAGGLAVILRDPALRSLLWLTLAISAVGSFGNLLLIPAILGRSGNNAVLLGSVVSALGLGGVLGGLAMTTWGGPKDQYRGMLVGLAGISGFGYLLLGLAGPAWLWLGGGFGLGLFLPLLMATNQALWQRGVPLDLMGRVTASRQALGRGVTIAVMVLGGPAADYLLEPALQHQGVVTQMFGALVGSARGSGSGLLFVIAGLFGIAVAGYSYLAVNRNTRRFDADTV